MDIVVKDLIQRLRTANDKVFVAGGFVRDTLMDNPGYRDVDVFLPVINSGNYRNEIDTILRTNVFGKSFNFTHTSAPEDGYPTMHTQIPQVYHCTFYGIHLDIVPFVLQKGQTTSPQNVLDTFDFGINQCAYDGENVVQTTACENDIKNRTLTLTNLKSIEELPKIMYQAARLQALYGLTFQTDIIEVKEKK